MADPAYIVDGVLTDGEAWVGIATTTLGVDTATVTFTSTDDGQVGDFSQYMDLVSVCYVRSDRSPAEVDDGFGARFNGDTEAAVKYKIQRLQGNGSIVNAAAINGWASTGSGWLAYISAADAATNVFDAVVSHFFDINSGKYQSYVSQGASDRNGAGLAQIYSGTWLEQAAITSIEFYPTYGSNLVAGSSISLFGILPRMVA